jgi:hypothetical protein
MSEIAIRCGRIKRDANGNESGETSWLARRIGTLPESGRTGGDPVGTHGRPGAHRAGGSGSGPARGRTCQIGRP